MQHVSMLRLLEPTSFDIYWTGDVVDPRFVVVKLKFFEISSKLIRIGGRQL